MSYLSLRSQDASRTLATSESMNPRGSRYQKMLNVLYRPWKEMEAERPCVAFERSITNRHQVARWLGLGSRNSAQVYTAYTVEILVHRKSENEQNATARQVLSNYPRIRSMMLNDGKKFLSQPIRAILGRNILFPYKLLMGSQLSVKKSLSPTSAMFCCQVTWTSRTAYYIKENVQEKYTRYHKAVVQLQPVES